MAKKKAPKRAAKKVEGPERVKLNRATHGYKDARYGNVFYVDHGVLMVIPSATYVACRGDFLYEAHKPVRSSINPDVTVDATLVRWEPLEAAMLAVREYDKKYR